MSAHLQLLFPGLRTTPFRITGPANDTCNCIAWAANDTSKNWWPVGGAYWPAGVPAEETISAFTAMFGTLGYLVGADEALEAGTEKVALFANVHDVPSHAARQLASGLWTSKIGELEVIEHELRALEGKEFGTVILVLRRPLTEESSA